jgi:hypothetical protein
MVKWHTPVLIIGAGVSVYLAYRKGLLGDVLGIFKEAKKAAPKVSSPADMIGDPTNQEQTTGESEPIFRGRPIPQKLMKLKPFQRWFGQT